MSNAHELQHPGTITFVDGTTQAIIRQVNASAMPFESAFVEVEEGQHRPVVHIEVFTSPDKLVILRFGPGGELLESTIQLRGV